MRTQINLPRQTAKGRCVPLSAEMLVNMYAEQAPDGARNDMPAIGCPGLLLFSSVAVEFGDYIRGVYWVSGQQTLWAVVGLTLYKISSTGGVSSIGTIGGYGRVSMADNGVELVVTTEAITYVVTLADDTLEAIADSDFPNADTVAFLGGYFVFNNNQSGSDGQLFWSSLYSGGTYDALDFATAENVPDDIVAVWRDHDRLLVFGDISVESWFLSGDSDAVFAPYRGATINRGLGARWSIANVDNGVIFLDESGIVRRIGGQGGYSAARISTHAIENLINTGSWRHDDSNAYDGAVASTYIEEGHEFYVLTVPDSGTYVFDAATGLWHQRKSVGLETYRASFHVRAFGKVICGDIKTGELYEQKLRYSTENGIKIIAEIQFPPIVNNNKRFIVNNIEINIEAIPGLSAISSSCNIDGVWATESSGADSAWESIVYGDKFVSVASSDVNNKNVQYSSDGETWETAVAGDVLASAATYTGINKSVDAVIYDSYGIVYDIQFVNEGNQLLVLSNNSFIVNHDIFSFTCSTPYEITTAVFTDSVDLYDADVNKRFTNVTGLFLTDDGLDLYVVGTASGGQLKRYTLSTAFDITTLTYASSFDVSGQSVNPYGVGFNDDYTVMSVYDQASKSVYGYTLTARDITTASYASKSHSFGADFSVGSYETKFKFAPGGLAGYYIHSNDRIATYTASTAYDVSTLSWSGDYVDLETTIGLGNSRFTSFTTLGETDTDLVVCDYGLVSPPNHLYQVSFADAVSLQAVTYSSSLSLYVAVGNDGAWYSSTGEFWIKGDLTTTQTWSGVCWSSALSLFIAVANGGTGNLVGTSPDGVTWTIRVHDQATNAAYANDSIVVAVGDNGVQTSEDAITWTARTEAVDNDWQSVIYASGVWVAVSNTGTGDRVMTSEDGITWVSQTSAADNNWNDVSYGSGYFVAVADSGTSDRIMRSRTGTSWTLYTSPADNGWNSLGWSSSLCVMAAVSDSGTGDRVMTSNTSAVTTEGGDTDPKIMLDAISLGGRRGDITQKWQSMGKEGEYANRVIFRRLGQHRSLTPKFSISDAAQRIVFDATADIENCD